MHALTRSLIPLPARQRRDTRQLSSSPVAPTASADLNPLKVAHSLAITLRMTFHTSAMTLANATRPHGGMNAKLTS